MNDPTTTPAPPDLHEAVEGLRGLLPVTDHERPTARDDVIRAVVAAYDEYVASFTAAEPRPRRFVLRRDEDVTGVSGTGVVAEGILFSSGRIALEWVSEFPTSVVFHDRGIESVQAVHGHNGSTLIVWLDT